MIMSNIIVRTGTFHIQILKDCKELFETLNAVRANKTKGIVGKDKDSYRLIYFRYNDVFAAGMLVRIRDVDFADIVLDDNLGQARIVNANKGIVRFYMDYDFNVILEDSKQIPRSKSPEIISNMIKRHLADLNNGIHASNTVFEITFDRTPTQTIDDFLQEVDILQDVFAKVKTMTNPHRTESQVIVAKALEELNMKHLNAHNSGGLNKNSAIITAIGDLSNDGHLNVTMSGKDAEGIHRGCKTDEKDDNSHLIAVENDSDINSFIRAINGVYRELKILRKKS